jgi:hypothetical protein
LDYVQLLFVVFKEVRDLLVQIHTPKCVFGDQDDDLEPHLLLAVGFHCVVHLVDLLYHYF